MITSALALLLMQVGPGTTTSDFPDLPDELRLALNEIGVL